jgi:hypothetical protein
MDTFRAAARKIERMIADVAKGGDINQSFDKTTAPVWKAINKLDDRTSKPEIRGDDAIREEAWGIVSALRVKMREAQEVGFEATQAARRGAIQGITDKARERRAAMDPALRQYEDELKLLRGK